MAWSIRNYNAFLRAAKSDLGISHTQAQRAYRSMAERTGRSLYAVDVARHPRMARQEAEKAVKTEARETRRAAREAREPVKRERAPRARGGEPAAAPAPAPTLQERAARVASVEEWERFIAGLDDLEWDDYESSEDPFTTGKAARK